MLAGLQPLEFVSETSITLKIFACGRNILHHWHNITYVWSSASRTRGLGPWIINKPWAFTLQVTQLFDLLLSTLVTGFRCLHLQTKGPLKYPAWRRHSDWLMSFKNSAVAQPGGWGLEMCLHRYPRIRQNNENWNPFKMRAVTLSKWKYFPALCIQQQHKTLPQHKLYAE